MPPIRVDNCKRLLIGSFVRVKGLSVKGGARAIHLPTRADEPLRPLTIVEEPLQTRQKNCKKSQSKKQNLTWELSLNVSSSIISSCSFTLSHPFVKTANSYSMITKGFVWNVSGILDHWNLSCQVNALGNYVETHKVGTFLSGWIAYIKWMNYNF